MKTLQIDSIIEELDEVAAVKVHPEFLNILMKRQWKI